MGEVKKAKRAANGKYYLIMPSDVKANGQLKYYRSQHLIHSRRSKQVANLGKEKSDRMHTKLVAGCDAKQARREAQRNDRRAKRQARKGGIESRIQSYRR